MGSVRLHKAREGYVTFEYSVRTCLVGGGGDESGKNFDVAWNGCVGGGWQ